jgi:hypothetical protein
MDSWKEEGFFTVQVISTNGRFSGWTSSSGFFSWQSISTPGAVGAWAEEAGGRQQNIIATTTNPKRRVNCISLTDTRGDSLSSM